MAQATKNYPPSASEGGFEQLSQQRVRTLQQAPSTFEEIVCQVRQALHDGILDSTAEGHNDLRGDVCAVINFRVTPELYEWFFNSRTGYRAQYWWSLEHGVNANALLVANLLALLSDLKTWPDKWNLKREVAMRSLLCAGAKVWIAERVGKEDLRNRIFKSPKLSVPKWHPDWLDEGRACAPRFPDHLCWLDLKGCLLIGEKIKPTKRPFKRARDINESGWT